MDDGQLRARLSDARVGQLATVDSAGSPHLVPFVFAVDGDRLVSAVDHKPKRTDRLKRLRNIEQNPSVAVLVDHYEDDWSQLWWVRADGTARIIETGDGWESAVELLAAKYPQYRGQPPTGAVIEMTIERLSGWSAV